MKKYTVETSSRTQTQDLAFALVSLLHDPLVILMRGDLGAGKTTFTQGLAKGLGIKQTVNSPTFTIFKMYYGRLPLYHIDAYRLEGISQDLGFEEYIEDSDGICVIDWPMYVQELVPEEYMEIELLHEGEDQRTMNVYAHGSAIEKIVEEWLCA